ncbi:MAG: class I SAM-dependent methyltransferase [Candidatus Hodarchaeales archaeon]|jgi:2-polyprenyl-3-methyl-5-hydroxy-6-metoxy-1,4-benzoquinol methylase
MSKSEKFWDKHANDYYEKGEKKFERTYSKTVENTRKYLNINDIVLDFACGNGIITNNLAESVKEIHALDLSPKMIDTAKRKADEHKITNITYARSTIFDKRYRQESFSVILAFNILHLIKDSLEIIQRINELLKPGGLFISETPCMGQKKLLFSILLFLPIKIGIIPYTQFLKFSELEGLVAKGKFQVIETDSTHSPPKLFIVAKKL